jgi:rhodanese-related sulfurtransferase
MHNTSLLCKHLSNHFIPDVPNFVGDVFVYICNMKRFIKTILIAQLCCVLFSCTAQVKNNLTADEFDKGISNKDSVQILDVRTPEEYASGHLKGSLLADWSNKTEFERRIAFIDKNKPVYVYCLAGGRSAVAASKLRNEGYQQVFELDGGINSWKAAGKPVEGKKDAKQMTIEEFNGAIQSAETVLVDFGAEWCPPCRKMEPVLKNLETSHAGKFLLVKVDGGKDEAVMKAYNVTALPVFIIFKDGKQVWRKDGVADEKEIAGNL